MQELLEREGRTDGRTMVVVAHRLRSVMNADVIFVLADGKVVEKGDHGSLLRNRGLYYEMVSIFFFCGRGITDANTCGCTVSITGS